jgi:hypothetical protein
MTKQNKILTGIIAGTLAIAGIAIVTNLNTTTATLKHYPIKDLLKIDAHQWDLASHPQQAGKEARTAALQKAILSSGFTGIRLYSDASVIKSDDNKTFKFNPDGRGYEQDSAIMWLKKANPNITIDFCYQNAPKNIQALWGLAGKKSTQYRRPNTDLNNPATWSELASDMAVIAARGGTNKSAPVYPIYVSPNWWDTKQVAFVGAGLYDVVEPQNELDNNWSNDEFLNGTQYAVLWKTVYDSVKKVDPNITVSTTGVMTEDPKVLTDAIAWAKANNSGVIPFDEYQFHCYPWGWSKNIASALPPEMNMVPAAKKVVAVSEGKPCVIGEWGYDLHPESNMGVRPFSNYTGEQIRSFWITRSLLGFAAVGIAKSYYYREYQDYGLLNDNNATIFETSSLFIKDDQDNITRRLSGDVFKQLSLYGDFVYDSTLAEDSSKVVYKFVSGTKKLYVGWTIEKVQLVTVNGTNRAQFTEVKLPFNFQKGIRLETQPGDSMLAQSFAGGSITLSSKPVFVLVDGSTPQPTPTPTPVPDPTPTKAIYHRGYWTINNKRVYYVTYTDGTWVLTNGKYVPL